MGLSIHLTNRATRSTDKGLIGTDIQGLHCGSFHYIGNGDRITFPTPVTPKWVWVQQVIGGGTNQYAAHRSDTMTETRAMASTATGSRNMIEIGDTPGITVNVIQPAGNLGNTNADQRQYSLMWFGGSKVVTGQYTGTGVAQSITPLNPNQLTNTSGLLFAEGRYPGDNTTGRPISTGFTPKLVVIKAIDVKNGTMRSNTMTAARCLTTSNSDQGISSFTSTGFTVDHIGGAVGPTNATGQEYIWWAIGGTDVKTGTYTGTTVDNLTISGVGFAAKALIVCDQDTSTSVAFRLSNMTTEDYDFGASAGETNRIKSINSNGFVLGTNTHVNAARTYHYIAINPVAGNLAIGEYTGNGSIRNIPPSGAIPFTPRLVHVKANAGQEHWFKTTSLTETDASMHYGANSYNTNRIQDLTPATGKFEVGTTADVNTSPIQYFWWAIGDNTGWSSSTVANMKAVFISSSGGSAVVYRSTAMDTTVDLSNSAISANKITAINATDFELGTDASVNNAGTVYDYIVFDEDTNLAVGSYTGSATDNKTWPRVGGLSGGAEEPVSFPITMALIRRRAANHPVWKSIGHSVGAGWLGTSIINFRDKLSTSFNDSWWSTATGSATGDNRIDSINTGTKGLFQVDNEAESNAGDTYYYLLTGHNTSNVVPTEPDIPSQGTAIPPILKDLTKQTKGLNFSTSMPSGFNSASFDLILPRAEAALFYQQYLGYGIHIYDGLTSIWEGRISNIALRDSGVTVSCEGYWASLSDEKLTNFFGDDDFSKWTVPIPHVGDLNTVDSSKAPSEALAVTKGRASVTFQGNNSTSAANQEVYVYYSLPHTNQLFDNRIYEPNSIIAIQFTAVSVGFTGNLKVWTADWTKGTWVERYSESLISTGMLGGCTRTLNLMQISDDEYPRTEAVAIGIVPADISPTKWDPQQQVVITNLRVFSRRDPIGAGLNTPRRMVLDLLRGAPPLINRPHGQQIEPDELYLDPNDAEIVPAVFQGQTFGEIVNQLNNFGSTVVHNWIDNPSMEVDTNGWASSITGSEAVTRIFEDDGVYGTYAIEDTLTRGAGEVQGYRIRPRSDTLNSSIYTEGRFPVKPSTEYTFMARCKRTSGLDDKYLLRINWYDERGVFLSPSADVNFTITTSYANYSSTFTSPSTASTCYLVIGTQTGNTDGAPVVRVSAARFVEGDTGTAYVDGNTDGYLWQGTPGASMTVKNYPLITGVFGHRQLHIKQRDETSIRWVIPISKMTLEGVELERDSRDQYTRGWLRYNELFTNIVRILGPATTEEAKILGNPNRNTEYTTGTADKGFADSLLQRYIEQNDRPSIHAQVSLKGFVYNGYGGREPCWRIRAGDTILIPDLTPLSPGFERDQIGAAGTRRDRMKTFIVKETSFDADNGTLSLVPDNTLDTIERALANISIVASVRSSTANAGTSDSWYGQGAFTLDW